MSSVQIKIAAKAAKPKTNKDVGNDHINWRLEREQHGNIPNEITDAQLDDYHFDITEVLTEKQLEKSRTGSAEKITEKNLNDTKPKFSITFRDKSTSEGNINKLEEFRLAKDPVEDEKYEDASVIPPKIRWWEIKSPDGLKIASSKKKLLAQLAPTVKLENLTEVEEEGAGIPDDMPGDPDELDESDIPDLESEYKSSASNMSVIADDTDADGRTITVKFDISDTGRDEPYITNSAAVKLWQQFPELKGVVEPENFDNPNYASGTISTYIPHDSAPELGQEDNNIDEQAVQPVTQEGTITSVGSNFNVTYIEASDKVNAAFDVFSSQFDPDDLTRANSVLQNAIKDTFLSPREEVQFLNKVRKMLSSSGVSIDSL